MTRIIVIDGMGGGIGAELVGRLRQGLTGSAKIDSIEIIALGTNASATERMLKAGAARGATGENAIRVSASLGDFIAGPIGIVIGNSMLGEITPDMAKAVLEAPGERVLLPLQNEHFHIAGFNPPPLTKQIDEAVQYIVGKIND
ncbi:MAG: DUF3842 family protein [Spirochaetaceae bacterium]|jgi:hypothetical protein|nr:DUF3842 family protein [Spirochaetaceae bacterium]